MQTDPQEYISLTEAAKFCSYSQEYLSLRARQGKLKSVKFGRNWVTKKEWLEEYLEKAEEYNNNFKIKKVVAPPENLPVEKLPVPKLRFAFVMALVFVLLVGGVVFGKESFKNVYQDLSRTKFIVVRDLDFAVTKFGENTDLAVKEIFATTKNTISLGAEGGGIVFSDMAKGVKSFSQNFSSSVMKFNEDVDEFLADCGRSFANVSDQVKSGVSTIFAAVENVGQLAKEGAVISAGDSFGSISENLKEFSQWVIKSYLTANDFVEKKIVQGYKALTQLFKAPEKISEEKLLPKPAEEGLVVIPSTEKDEEVVKKIKESFSDEVKVEPVDKTSGIIIPIFREREGEKYLYILVPIHY